MGSWAATPRALEEKAAAANDLLLTLNAAEKIRPNQREAVLRLVVHTLPEGQSTAYSNTAQSGGLPDLRWSGLTLSTSNRPIMQIARASGMEWEGQERARLIDIPVPGQKDGGIADLLTGGREARIEGGMALVDDLSKAISTNYGMMIGPWIEYLMSLDDLPSIIEKYQNRLFDTIGPTTDQIRVARKVALPYMAGRLARKAGLFRVDKNLPLKATLKLYRLSLTATRSEVELLAEGLNKLKKVLTSDQCLRVDQSESPVLGPQHIAVRYRREKFGFYGIRLDKLQAEMGAVQAKIVLDNLDAKNAWEPGQGGKRTVQLGGLFDVAKGLPGRPRFLVIRGRILQDVISGVRTK